MRLLLIAVPLVFAVEIVPLPAGIVRVLSPTRVWIDEAAGAVLGSSRTLTLSAAPVATFEVFLSVAGCVLVFLLVRELACRFEDWPWVPVLPLVAVAAMEAALGVVQVYTQAGAQVAHGTYVNRDHFAGLLEVCLPFAMAYGLATLARSTARRGLSVARVLHACVLFAVATLLLVAVIRSESRMGFVGSLLALAVVAGAELGKRHHRVWKWLWVPAVLSAVAAGFVFLPTDPLIGRFAEVANMPELSRDTRLEIWRDSVPLIRDYPLLGCGLGAYESVMTRYKSVEPLHTLDFAHNDYLQLLAEGGVVGFFVVMALAVMVTTHAARSVSSARRPEYAYLSSACLGALAAILLHSMFDFNLHIPANAMAVAWIGGLAMRE
jgi:O-antigen ligase